MSELRPEDRGWIEAVERELRPEPMDARRALAFRRELEEKLAGRDVRRRRALPTLAVAAAAAALALWLVRPGTTTPDPIGSEDTVVFDAFVDPDTGADAVAAAEGYLPGDYLVLATLLDDAQ